MHWQYIVDAVLFPGDSAFDIGAHEGNYARYLSKVVGSSGKIFAFEPHPKKFEILKNQKFQNVDCQSRALSDRVGDLKLYFGLDAFADQASTTVPEMAGAERLGSQIKHFTVKADTLDFFCAERSIAPTFLKVDVEGAEAMVFTGAEKTIHKYRPAIFFEQNLNLYPGVPRGLDVLQKMGYIFAISDMTEWRGNILFVSESKFLRRHLIEFNESDLGSRQVTANIFAVPAERAEILKRFPAVKIKKAFEEMIPVRTPSQFRQKSVLFLQRILPQRGYRFLQKTLKG